jgi:hypothetical protein
MFNGLVSDCVGWLDNRLVRSWAVNMLVSSKLSLLLVCLLASQSASSVGIAQPAFQCVQGAISARAKQTGREANHSPPSNAEVKNMSSWHSAQLITLRDNFVLSGYLGVYMYICTAGHGSRAVLAYTVFARSESGIVDSNPTQSMDVWYVHVFIPCLCCPVFR